MTDENWQEYRSTLDSLHRDAESYLRKKDTYLKKSLREEQLKHVKTIVDNAEKQKSVLAVLITSLLKKIKDPSVDIRYHRKEFIKTHGKGYAGRVLDTNIVTPWLKEKFPKFAPKESGWLTRSIEQPHPFTLDFPGKIKDKRVKEAFLYILHDVEENKADARIYLTSILILLLDKVNAIQETIKHLNSTKVEHRDTVTIYTILDMLEAHFSTRQSSRLPVIAIYSIYQLLLSSVDIYKDKKLSPLKPHTASDRYSGYGDIEIYNNDGSPFEIVEIKHKIPIDMTMIHDVLNKIKGTSIKRYFILTTAEPNFKVKEDEKEIFNFLYKIKNDYDIDIIPNGILPSLKYYLRFIANLTEFLNIYTKNLIREFNEGTDIKSIHIEKWENILKNHGMIHILPVQAHEFPSL